MANFKILSKKPVSLGEIKSIVTDIKKSEKRELSYREEKILDYLKVLKPLTKTNIEKLKVELNGLEISRLDDIFIVKLIDIMPKNGSEIRAIVSHSGIILVDESITKILDTLNKYRK
jgi:DNA-directed RNA polymerase subunit F